MRDIIFRGKTVKSRFSIFDEKPIKETGDWVYGDLEYQRAKGKCLIHAYYSDGTYDHQYEIDEKTVGQYTDCKDDKGKMIFEGDLIRYKYEESDSYTGWHGIIEVVDEVVFEYCSFRLKNTYPFDISSLWDMNKAEVEVIGNIFDEKKT